MPGRPWTERTTDSGYPGERLGLPAAGVGSVAGFGRRLAALTVDWFIGYGIAAIFATPDPRGQPLVRLARPRCLVRPDRRAGRGVRRERGDDGARDAGGLGRRSRRGVGVRRALLRTALIAVVAPPLVRDVDGRGWHDRAARTVVVRTPPVSARQRRRTVRWTLRIFAPGGQRALRQRRGARAQRGEARSRSSIWSVEMLRGSLVRVSGARAGESGPRRCRRRSRRSACCRPPARCASSPARAGSSPGAAPPRRRGSRRGGRSRGARRRGGWCPRCPG